VRKGGGGWSAGGSTGCDARSSSLQRLVRRFRSHGSMNPCARSDPTWQRGQTSPGWVEEETLPRAEHDGHGMESNDNERKSRYSASVGLGGPENGGKTVVVLRHRLPVKRDRSSDSPGAGPHSEDLELTRSNAPQVRQKARLPNDWCDHPTAKTNGQCEHRKSGSVGLIGFRSHETRGIAELEVGFNVEALKFSASLLQCSLQRKQPGAASGFWGAPNFMEPTSAENSLPRKPKLLDRARDILRANYYNYSQNKGTGNLSIYQRAR
jgi:hypothetical protein